jgi:hypothetical protein
MSSYLFLFPFFLCVVKLIPLTMSVLACYYYSYYSAETMKFSSLSIVIAAMMVASSVGDCRDRFLRGGAVGAERRLSCCDDSRLLRGGAFGAERILDWDCPPDPTPPLENPNTVISFFGFTNEGSFPGVFDKLLELSQQSITTQQNVLGNTIIGGTIGGGQDLTAITTFQNNFPTSPQVGDNTVLTNNAIAAIGLSLSP